MSQPSTPDSELVDLVKSGQTDAFSRIVSKYQNILCSIAYSKCGDFSKSEDLAQDSFLEAWKSIHKLKDPSSLKSWLCGIVRNLSHKHHAKKVTTLPIETIDHTHESVESSAEPIDRIVKQEEQQLIWDTLEKIPERYREPLILFYRESQSISKVASVLNLNEDTVKQQLSRGRKLLHEHMLTMVEDTLSQTKPESKFTHAVMAALPLSSTLTKVGISSTAGKALTVKFSWVYLIPLIGLYFAWVHIKDSETKRLKSFRIKLLCIHMATCLFASLVPLAFLLTPSYANYSIAYFIASTLVLDILLVALFFYSDKQHVKVMKEENVDIHPLTMFTKYDQSADHKKILKSQLAGFFAMSVSFGNLAYHLADIQGVYLLLALSFICFAYCLHLSFKHPHKSAYYQIVSMFFPSVVFIGLLNVYWVAYLKKLGFETPNYQALILCNLGLISIFTLLSVLSVRRIKSLSK